MFSKFSVKKPYTVIVGIILVIVLGYISFTKMTTDLLPSMNLPYVVVYTSYVGATPEQVESEVTRPMEAAVATLTDVKKITSSSRDNVSVVIMQFNDGANMDTALIELNSRLEQLRGGWDDAVGAPVALKLNPDMLPVAILSVSRDDMDILALSEYVEDELVPSFESLNGVASASASGVIEQRVDVVIEQSRIDVLNSAILRDVDAELADVEQELNDAQAQLSDGKRQLARARRTAFQQIDDALNAIDQGEQQIQPAIDQLTAKRAELQAQRDQLAQAVASMEALVNMDDNQRAALVQTQQALAALKQQQSALQQQLDALEATGESDALKAARSDLEKQVEELTQQRDAQKQYLDDLALLSTDALRGEIEGLEASVAENEGALSDAQAELTRMQGEKASLERRVAELEALIREAEGTPTEAPSEEPTEAPSGEPTEAPSGEPTEAPSEEPTEVPSGEPTEAPSGEPTEAPSEEPTEAPSEEPTEQPSEAPAGENDENADPAAAGLEATPSPEATPEPTDTPAPDALALFPFAAAQAEESDLSSLRSQLDQARQDLADLNAAIDSQTGSVDALSQTLAADRQRLAARQQALATLTGENEDIASRQAEAQRQVEALDARISALGEELDQLNASTADTEALRQQSAALQAQIDAIENSDTYKAAALASDPEALNAQYTEAQAGLAQLDAGIAQIDGTLDKLKKGIIPAGYIDGIDEDTKLSDARTQLEAARKQAESAFSNASQKLRDGEAELAKARKEFNEKRDEALENAGLDGVITMQMVSGLIGAQNFSMPAGYVYDAENEQVLVRVGDKFDTLDALRRMKLFELGLDSIDEVRLLDVASVELTDNRDEVFTKLNGADGILLSLDKQSTYSTADVAKTILARADALMAEDPNLHIVDLMNQGEYIDIIVSSVLNNLLTGGGLAILILLLFLMDFRPTVTVAFSIPISVVIAFVCMYFTGITLNVLSLSGLSLGIGMLVDNSIVAIENIYRLHDEEGVPLLRACVEGVKSVSGALFASTLTTICVFLPIVFVQGMARDLFADMGLTIAFSLLASLLVAMTVVPAMCSFLMRHSKPHRHRVFGAIQRFYTSLLRGALKAKPLVLLAALALLAFAAMQVPKMGISFMPQVNSRQMSADLAFAPEMTDDDQKAQAMAIMDGMMAVEGVESVGLMGGSGGMLSGLSGGSGMSYYIMVDESSGRRNVDIASEISAIGERLGADLSVQASTMDISMMTGSGISVEITGDDIETLQSIALDVAEIARGTEGVIDVEDGLEDAVPELRIEVDKEKAIENGLTTAQVFQFVAQKVTGRTEITQVTFDGREYGVFVADGANADLRPEDLEDLEIEVDGEEENKLVRVGDVADIRQTSSLSTINRASQRRNVTVTFGVADGYSANHVSDAFEARLKDYDVPAGYNVTLGGENETVMAIMQDLIWMVLVAILLIFLIMVAQFQSFKSPIIVMFTIPLAFTGGLLALLLTGMDLSIVSMLGFLVLSGVVVNNGIVFIDCVNQLRIGGMEKKEALIETGRIRLRPILMTALTTILGMSTMALGQGTGAEMMQPMAVVSIGGLTYATLMTLFVVPVLYDLVNGKTMKAREIQMIKEAAGMTDDSVLDGEDRIDAEAPTEPAPAAEAPVVEAPAEPAPAAEAPVVEAPTEPVPAAEVPAAEIPTEPAPAAEVPALSPDFSYTTPSRPLRIKLGKR